MGTDRQNPSERICTLVPEDADSKEDARKIGKCQQVLRGQLHFCERPTREFHPSTTKQGTALCPLRKLPKR